MRELEIRNAQRARRIRSDQLRIITRSLLEDLLGLTDYQLAVRMISPAKMAKINRDYLQHEGSTDVITFDYREGYEDSAASLDLSGEIFISVEDAVRQAAEFRTTWPEELVRYIVHGVLHLQGYDDLSPAERKVMKREETRLLRQLAKTFPLGRLAG